MLTPKASRTAIATCPICQQVHEYTPGTVRGRKCAPCFRKESADRLRRYMQAKRPPPHCTDCGVQLPTVEGKGKRRLRCDECHLTHLRHLDAIRYYERRREFIVMGVCQDCGAPFPRVGKGGPVPRCCPDCAGRRGRDRDRAHCRLRYARKMNVRVEYISSLTVHERDNWICGICGTSIDGDLEWPDPASPSVDHVQPLSRGGAHVMDNVQAAHLICNLRKATKYIPEQRSHDA